MFWEDFFVMSFIKDFLIMSFILSPALILFGMIIFSGKPKDRIERAEIRPGKTGADGR